MSPRRRFLYANTHEFLQECLETWRRRTAVGEQLPQRYVDLLLLELDARPNAWIVWRQNPGFPDEMLADIWGQCLADDKREQEEAPLAALATSWQKHPEILKASPVLGALATDLLIRAVWMDAHAVRKFQRALRTVLEAIPPKDPVRYSTCLLETLIVATASDRGLSTPLIATVARQLGLDPAVVRAVWFDRSSEYPHVGDRRRLALLLMSAPVDGQPGVKIAGSRSLEGPMAATPWSFYRDVVSPILHDDLLAEGEETVVWAWGHPPWRAAMLAHAGDLVLMTTPLWKSPHNVRVALEVMAAHADTWPVHSGLPIARWLHEVLDAAPLDAWSQVAAIMATAGDDQGRARGLWGAFAGAVKARPHEVVESARWLPWLQSTDSKIRAEALFAVSAEAPQPPRSNRRREAPPTGR